MTDTVVMLVKGPGGGIVAVPVVDLDGSAVTHDADGELPSLAGALRAVTGITAALREALETTPPEQTTVTFAIGFAAKDGQINAMVSNDPAASPFNVTLELGATGD